MLNRKTTQIWKDRVFEMIIERGGKKIYYPEENTLTRFARVSRTRLSDK
jgi:hypothetical protein